MDKTALTEFKKVCHKYLVIKDSNYIDFIFAVILANRTDSKPVWAYLVGPPSSGKTEIVQALDTDEIFAISKLTNKSLISGIKPTPKQPDASLIPKLNGKILVIKDFTAMLSSRRDKMIEIIGTLRDAYDGKARNYYGTGEDKYYKSKFGVIAAVTNVIDKHRGLLAELGERFLTYRCPLVRENELVSRCWKASGSRSVIKQERELRMAASRVLTQDIYKVILSDSFRKKIIDIARYTAIARCEVQRDPYTKEPEIPQPEIATRLTHQLCDLAAGLTILHNKKTPGIEELQEIQKVALDSLTLKRLRLLQIMLKHFPEPVSVDTIVAEMRFSQSIVYQWIEDAHLLGLLYKIETTQKSKIPGKKYLWKLTDGLMLQRIWKKFYCRTHF